LGSNSKEDWRRTLALKEGKRRHKGAEAGGKVLSICGASLGALKVELEEVYEKKGTIHREAEGAKGNCDVKKITPWMAPEQERSRMQAALRQYLAQ